MERMYVIIKQSDLKKWHDTKTYILLQQRKSGDGSMEGVETPRQNNMVAESD